MLLQLLRTPAEPQPSREVRISDGAVLMQSDGDKRISQQALVMAVLGEMGRMDAVPTIAEMASEGPDHLRWEALRQVLAMDTLAGLALLETISQYPGDGLCEPATALKSDLLRQYPQLRELVSA